MFGGTVRGRRSVALLVPAAMLALLGGTLAAAPASAADECAYSGDTAAALPADAFQLPTVVLGVSSKTFRLTELAVPQECAADVVGWKVSWGHGITFASDQPATVFNPRKLTPGSARATLSVLWEGQDEVEVTSFTTRLLKATTFGRSFNAIGEPLVAGDPLYLKGTLGVADWKTGKYVPYKGRTVHVRWKQPGPGSYRSFGTEKTDSKGHLRAYWTGDDSGTWQLAYGGNSVAASSTSNGDYVEVVPR